MTIRRGDILWADLGMFPTTSVQGGVRPVIVVSNNKANTYEDMGYVVKSVFNAAASLSYIDCTKQLVAKKAGLA